MQNPEGSLGWNVHSQQSEYLLAWCLTFDAALAVAALLGYGATVRDKDTGVVVWTEGEGGHGHGWGSR